MLFAKSSTVEMEPNQMRTAALHDVIKAKAVLDSLQRSMVHTGEAAHTVAVIGNEPLERVLRLLDNAVNTLADS